MMSRRRVSGAKVSKPVMLYNTVDPVGPEFVPRHAPKVPSTPSSISSVPSTPDPPSLSSFENPLPLDECEELLDDYDPIYEKRREEAYLASLSSLQGSRQRSRATSHTSSHCQSGTASTTDSLSRRLSTISTASKLSKRRTLRLSKSVPTLAAPPVISHPMPLGAARRIRKVPSLQQVERKGRLSALPRMFAWRH
ncbi:hypothetical protein A1Q2_03986 [Trichosporon asahii var. asahii CBS 8904]|uniref:Uncharacterized protein n=1 Tax=Trichosporon asahii var. asahii (strain CBS 8904) TaxID=1220162 RepID=K1WKB6_TRIAC|nr:hypothetical protein A1Q2_03986 [Trichosporon asahii var. asahii CBS 8904]